MFEKVVIRRHAENQKIDAGLLAETLLYYSNVHLAFDGASLSSALKTLGGENLVRLLEERRITATYYSDLLATINSTKGGVHFYDMGAVSLHAKADGRKVRPRDMATEAFDLALGKSSATTKLANKFIDLAKFKRQGDLRIGDLGVGDAARRDLEDRKYIRDAVEIVIRSKVPEVKLPNDWFFYAVKAERDGYNILTNLNFHELNRISAQVNVGRHKDINVSSLLMDVLSARADMQMASDYMAEFVTDATMSALIQKKFSQMLGRRGVSTEQISLFQEVALTDARSLREVINSGERSFEDFLKLLDKAEKFKEWLRTTNSDANLLSEYLAKISSDTWMDRLPPKVAKFAVFALGGVGLEALVGGGSGVAAGVALSAGDQFFVEKLLRGWKPNQFIEGPLKEFTRKE